MKKLLFLLFIFANLTFGQSSTLNQLVATDSIRTPDLFLITRMTDTTSRKTTWKMLDDYTHTSHPFMDGWQNGYGWRIDSANNEFTLTIDNIIVRGTMSAYQFLINQIKVNNGNLLVTSSASVNSVASDQSYFYCDSAAGINVAPFVAGDMIMAQEVDLAAATFDSLGNISTPLVSWAAKPIIPTPLIKRLIYLVTNVTGLKVTVGTLSGAPANYGQIQAGDIFVRFGNTSLSSGRCGLIGLYSDDQNSPYLMVTDSVNSWSAWKSPASVKVRLGRLDGLTIGGFGTLSGYGLYANRFYFYGDTNNYLAYNGNSFTSRISGHDLGTSITQNDSSINLLSESVYSTQYNTLDTNWTLQSQSWSSNGQGLKSSLLDSVFSLRSGINITSDSIKLFSNKIVQSQNNIATNTASITLNSNSITSLVNSTNLLTDSLYSYGTKIMQNGNSIALTSASLLTTQGQVHSDSATIIVNSNNITALVDSTTIHGDTLRSHNSRILLNSSNIALGVTATTNLAGKVATDSARITINADSIVSLVNSRTLQGDTLISHNTRIIQNDSSITSIASIQTLHGDSLLSHNSRLNINAGNISLVSSSLTTTQAQVHSDSAAIIVNSNNILLKANSTTTDSLINGQGLIINRVNADSARIDVNTSSILLRAYSTTTDSLRTRTNQLVINHTTDSSGIAVNANNISLGVTATTNLAGKVSTDSARITVNSNNISLVSSSVYSVQYYQLTETNWIAMAASWASNGNGLKSQLLDSIFTLRSGINVNSDSIKLFSSKIVQTQNNIASNTASITLNSNSIASLVTSNSLLLDSLYSYGTLIMQNKNNIILSASKYTNGDTLISYINLSPDSLRLSSRHINIDGYTTFGSGYNPNTKIPYSDTSNTANHINWNTTTINGGKLTTGTVIADSIRSHYLYSDTLIGGYISGMTITGGNIYSAGNFSTLTYIQTADPLSSGPITGAILSSNSLFLITSGHGQTLSAMHNIPASLDALSTSGNLNVNGAIYVSSAPLNFSNLAGAVTTAQTNLSTTTAPSWSAGTPPNVYYGSSATYFLAVPTTWIQIKVGSTTYKVPAY